MLTLATRTAGQGPSPTTCSSGSSGWAYRREQRRWLPHVTVVRFRERPRAWPDVPELPGFSPSDAAVYLSRLRPTGAQYVVLESFGLGG